MTNKFCTNFGQKVVASMSHTSSKVSHPEYNSQDILSSEIKNYYKIQLIALK